MQIPLENLRRSIIILTMDEFYPALGIGFGQLGQDMGSGRKKGDRFIELTYENEVSSKHIVAFTYIELRKAVFAGISAGILIPIIQGLLH